VAALKSRLAPISANNSGYGAHTHIRWVFLALLLLASVMNYIDRQTLSILAVSIQRDMRLSDVQYGYIVQCFLLLYMIMYAVSGQIVDRVGVRRSQGMFLLIWSAADALTGFATGLFSLMLFRGLLGASEPGNYTASLRAVGDWFSEKERSFAVGVYSMGGTLGAAIAVPLTAVVALRYGWRSAFYVTGAIGVVLSLLWFALYRDPETSPRVSRKTIPINELLRQPYIFELLLTRLLTDSVWYFFLFWIPKYMQDVYHFSLMTLGSTLWIFYIAADVGSFAGGAASGMLIQRKGLVGARIAVMIPAAIGMLLLSVVWRVRNPFIALTIFSVLALCHMAWMTNATTMTLDLFGKQTVASVQGMIGTASAAGGFLSSALIAHAVQSHEYQAIFVALALMHPISAIVLYVRLRPAIQNAKRFIMESAETNA
jgi:ACS family hexuronate transporter-like MFS transporter